MVFTRTATRISAAAGPVVMGVWLVGWLWHASYHLYAVLVAALVIGMLQVIFDDLLRSFGRELVARRRLPYRFRRAPVLAALTAAVAIVALLRGAPWLALVLGLDVVAVACFALISARLGHRAGTTGRSGDLLG